MNIENVAKRIKENLTTKDYTVITFIMYFKLHLIKGWLLKRGIQQSQIWKHINDEKHSFNLKSVENLEVHLRNEFNELNRLYGYKVVNIVKTKWNELGLDTIQKEIEINKNGIQNIIELLDEEFRHLTIDSTMDLFEELNGSDRGLNDYFTPTSLSKLIGKMVSSKEYSNTINIYDPSIGMGRLMYYSVMELKEKHPLSVINVFGVDLNSRFAVFTESLLSLINFNRVFIEVGNTLKDNFKFPKIDMCISNPPYDGKIEYEFLEHIKKLNCKTFAILPNGFTFQNKVKKLRKELIDNNLLKTVVQLPEKLFKNTNIATVIIELDNNPLLELEKLCINNKLDFLKIDYSKDVKSQIKEFEEKYISTEEPKREINLIESRNKITDAINQLHRMIGKNVLIIEDTKSAS
jgi:type I restriction-modification system DNA methylase subunit